MSKKNIYLLGIAILMAIPSLKAQTSENLVVVTLDGMRWQEVFGGVDEQLMKDSNFTHEREGMKKAYWSEDPNQRRKQLFPFLWSTFAEKGQLYGNRLLGNNVDNSNRYWFSYPGYNEIFTGYPDTAVNSNDKIINKNENVLSFINKQKGYAGKVAVFSTWDVFPYILDAKRTGLYVNADVDTLKFDAPGLKLVNDMQFLAPRPIGVRPDLLTYFAAREYLKAYKPKVLYIAFDETDDYAHNGNYDQYITSAHAEDGMIADLWNTLQSMPQYKGKTTLLVTCDHGRGDKVKANWKHHGSNIEDAHQIWFAIMGPAISPAGEMKTAGQLYQKQFAATMASILGFTFTANHPIGDPITLTGSGPMPSHAGTK